MFNRNSYLRRRVATLAIVLAISIGILVPKRASAALTSVVCSTIVVVEYQENQLIMTCSGGADFYGQSSTVTAGCPVKTVDTLKSWQALATSALLSGKSTKLWYDNTTCGGHSYLVAVDLLQ